MSVEEAVEKFEAINHNIFIRQKEQVERHEDTTYK